MGNTVSFKKEFGLILVGGIIFTASLLWKDLLVEVEELYFPKDRGLVGRLFFVFTATLVLIALAVHLKGLFGISGNEKSSVIKYDENPAEILAGLEKEAETNNSTPTKQVPARIDNVQLVDKNNIQLVDENNVQIEEFGVSMWPAQYRNRSIYTY